MYHWHDGDKYEGEWLAGNCHGQGVKTYAEQEMRYIGSFANDLREGKGKIVWENGNRFEGAFKDDKIEGPGTYFWADGDMFKGTWVAGKEEGVGKLYQKGGKVIS